MPEPTKKVVVVGQGYVGLPLAMRAVEVGYEVVGFDKDPRRVELLATATSYVEDVSSEQLVRGAGQRPLLSDNLPGAHRGVRRRPDNGANPSEGGRPRPFFRHGGDERAWRRTSNPAPSWCSSRRPTPALPKSCSLVSWLMGRAW